VESLMKLRSWLPVIGGCVAITAVLAWFKVSQIQQAIAFGKSFGEPVEFVELAIAEQTLWQQSVAVTADVVAMQTLELTNELDGRVVELGFSAGDTVRKGQILLRQDTSEEQAQLAAAQADAELARLALERNEKLVKTGVTSVAARDQALAQRQAAIAAEDRLKAIIDKKTIRAPFDAVVGIFDLEPGQYLQANTPITRLVGSSDQVWLDFNLPQQQATLKVGDKVAVSMPRSGVDTLQATIIARDSSVNPRSGNLMYRAIADNAEGKLYPGTVVSMAVAVGEPQQATRVPMNAIRYDAFGPNVYRLEAAEEGAAEGERAVKRRVVLGPEQDQQVVVITGVEPGDRVAGNGAFKLRDGILVRAVTTPAAAGKE
jgi:membrane fusion protein (multidrug efflux system)